MYTTEAFARLTEIPEATIDAIIGGCSLITYDIALRVEHSLGIMPELWFALQSRWDRHPQVFQVSA